MTWLHLSILGNIILGVVLVIFALDRQYFHKTCMLRHNPIDKAVIEIKQDIGKIFGKLDEMSKVLYTHITDGGSK